MSSYPEILARMFELQKFGIKLGLDSMLKILNRLGNPHIGGKYVHIAGTNGKGSTASMLAQILKEAGLTVGLYTSPHLVSFQERILIDGQKITEDQVACLAAEVWEGTDPDSPPTFFEFVTAMAILHFQRQEVDLAIMETGLGGRLDSTNVITPLLSAVTNVSLEHTEQLGNTISQIASEKAGIIKPGVPFVGGRLKGTALEVIKGKLAQCSVTKGLILDQDYQIVVSAGQCGRPTFDYHGPAWELQGLTPALAGSYQADNAAMAVAMAETLISLGYRIESKAVHDGLSRASWPGRAETFLPGTWPPDGQSKAPLLLDGAHNPAGASALADLLVSLPRRRLHLIVGVMADKDIVGVLGPILPQADRLYLTRPRYHRAASPELLLERLTNAFGPPVCATGLYETLPQAIDTAAREASPQDLVVVSGSLFTVGEARAYLTGAPVVEPN
ncbi:MAG: bifunctional folylpolyglutamate synthase/dihydrofolate synthase [Deltaproteobacteria bacterium]|nr:bifunctional folylpolyglutamate synthase/dihydrofolate synthase [Deltaproteobacteria bacterium]